MEDKNSSVEVRAMRKYSLVGPGEALGSLIQAGHKDFAIVAGDNKSGKRMALRRMAVQLLGQGASILYLSNDATRMMPVSIGEAAQKGPGIIRCKDLSQYGVAIGSAIADFCLEVGDIPDAVLIETPDLIPSGQFFTEDVLRSFREIARAGYLVVCNYETYKNSDSSLVWLAKVADLLVQPNVQVPFVAHWDGAAALEYRILKDFTAIKIQFRYLAEKESPRAV